MFSNRSLIAISFSAVAVGFLVGFWPLCVVGVLLAAVSGRWVTAVLLGLLLDIAFGIPTGVLHVVYLPFTALAFVSVIGHLLLAGRLRKGSSDTV